MPLGDRINVLNTHTTTTAIKEILVMELITRAGIKIQYLLEEFFANPDWRRNVRANKIYVDTNGVGWWLKPEYAFDRGLLPVTLTSGNKSTYFSNLAGLTGGGGTSNLTLGTNTGTTQTINNSNGTGVILPSATTSTAGLLSGADKTILDNLASGQGESVLVGNGTTPAIPTANQANWKLNTIYLFNVDSVFSAITLADGTTVTTAEKGASLQLTKTGVSTYAYILRDAYDNQVQPVITITSATPLVETTVSAITATNKPTTYLITGTDGGIIVPLPLASSQKFDLTIGRNDYTPSRTATLITQGSDKIDNSTTLPLDTGTSLKDSYILRPTSTGYFLI